ncbi:hypothetical protein IAU59_006796 [Kwoniella sp. CBS 9459]
MFSALSALLPILATAALGVQAVALAGGKARLSSRQDDQGGKYSRIHPNGNEDLCLTVQKANSMPLTIHLYGIKCQTCSSKCFGDGHPYQAVETWTISPAINGLGQIKLSQNDQLCLNTGYTDKFGENSMILSPCIDSVQWNVSGLGGGATTVRTQFGSTWYCVDVKEGSEPFGADPYGWEKETQRWQCADGNTNQQWTIENIPYPAEWKGAVKVDPSGHIVEE